MDEHSSRPVLHLIGNAHIDPVRMMKPSHDRTTQSAAANAPGEATAATSHQTMRTIPTTNA